jgi:hypothetical protein
MSPIQGRVSSRRAEFFDCRPVSELPVTMLRRQELVNMGLHVNDIVLIPIGGRRQFALKESTKGLCINK